MRAPSLVLPGAAAGARLTAGPEHYRHLVRVLRRQVGDPLQVLDGQGGVFRATLESIDAGTERLVVLVEGAGDFPPPPLTALTVGVALPRGEGIELALRWGSELGLARLIPLLTARGMVRAPAERGERKLERWRRIARESAEQCGRAVPLEVAPPTRLEALVREGGSPPRSWIALPGGPDPAASGLLECLRGPAGDSPGPAALVLVGPEGGWDPREVSLSIEAGCRPVGFSTPILRTPTAVLYLGALASIARCLG